MSERELHSPLYSKITHINFCLFLSLFYSSCRFCWLVENSGYNSLHERLVDFQRSHCELLRGEFYRMKSKVHGLQKELSETKEVKSQLEHQKVERERELSSLRYCTPRF